MFYKLQYLLWCIPWLSAAMPAQARVWFVFDKASGVGTGQSWENAFHSLQEALQAARAGDDIWVAKGIYKPAQTNPGISFRLKDGVRVFGHFEGHETSVEQRRFDAGTPGTWLDGNLPGGVRSNQVVSVAKKGHYYLDGCVITGGMAVGDAKNGGGLHIDVDSDTLCMTLVRCYFVSNAAQIKGGGLCAITRKTGVLQLRLTNCRFEQCIGSEGGGMHAETLGGQLQVIADSCGFYHNKSEHKGLRLDGGGAVHLLARQNGQLGSRFTACVFEKNSSPFDGGALTAWAIEKSVLSLEMDQCRLDSNYALENGGGALHLRSDDPDFRPYGSRATGRLLNCVFTRNSSNSDAGAVIASSRGNGRTMLHLNKCLFNRNHAPFGGAMGCSSHEAGYTCITAENSRFIENEAVVAAGVLRHSAHRTASVSGGFTNCLFAGNRAGRLGAAIWNDDSSTDTDSLVFVHCTFYQNRSPRQDWFNDLAGIRYGRFINCILEANLAAGLSPEGNVDVVNCLLEPAFPGAGNLVGTPVFEAPDMGDFRLTPESPGVDAGLRFPQLPATDLAGAPRIIGNRPDMGAFEVDKTTLPPTAGGLLCRQPVTIVLPADQASHRVTDRGLDPMPPDADWRLNNNLTGASTLEGADLTPGIYRVLWTAEKGGAIQICSQRIVIAGAVLSPGGVRTLLPKPKN